MSDKIVIVTAGGKKKVITVASLISQNSLPSEIPASYIVEDSNNRFVTDTEKTTWNSGSTPVDISGKVDKVSGHSLVSDTLIGQIHASGSDNQDLSGKVDKVTGKGLSANDLTDTLKGYYDGAYNHSQATHAPSNAQKNSDITKEEIEAKLTGAITTHSHAGGTSPTAWGKYF